LAKPAKKSASKATARASSPTRKKATSKAAVRKSKSSKVARATKAKAAKTTPRKAAAKKKRTTQKRATRKVAAKRPRSSKKAAAEQAESTDRLLHLESALAARMVGKEDAISKLARVIRVRRTDLGFRPERPDGSFLLVGPSGVGKNEVAHALSEVLYGTDERVTSIDLGEIGEEEDLSKLGATMIPGDSTRYVPGMLTAPVREDPSTIILLRGLERAHIAFQRLLLSVLERGTIEDMLGPVNFGGAVVITTMQLSREDLGTSEIGFNRSSRTAAEIRREQLERFVMPDLLDAFNEVIELPPLTIPEVRQIARYKVDKVLQRMQEQRTAIDVSSSVYDELITERLCNKAGAKFLNRTLEERLFNPLSRYLLTHQGSKRISVGVDAGAIVIAQMEPPEED